MAIHPYLETAGYIASLIILISLIMTSIVKLRVLNAFGSAVFAVYALLIHSYPVFFMNTVIVIINLYYLRKISKTQDYFDILPVDKNNEIIQHFYTLNIKEINELFIPRALEQADKTAFYFRNNDIAGILAYSIVEPHKARILVDYVTAKYRDSAVGRHFFVKDISFWHKQDILELEIYAPGTKHIPYIEKLGFRQSDDPATWHKDL